MLIRCVGPAVHQRRTLSGEAPIGLYQPPDWAAALGGLRPRHRLDTSRLVGTPTLATPVQHWPIGGREQYWIKRDDLSCAEVGLAGNKLRKLEFLLADAVAAQQADCLLTIGAVQSNHVRATAALGQKLGLKVFACVRGQLSADQPSPLSGNVLLDVLCGAELFPISAADFAALTPAGALAKLRQHVVASTPFRRPYVVPLGGSNALGAWGYINAVAELIEAHAGTALPYEHIVCTAGSGGTLAGLAIGAAAAGLTSDRTGAPVQLHGYAVCDNAAFFERHVDEQARAIWPLRACRQPLARVVDSYRGLGYGKSTDDELALLCDIAATTGVLLDPVYTVKTARGMLNTDFGSDRVLFVHTGGALGLWDAAKLDQLRKHVFHTTKIVW